ncbi:hypothetical protein [Prevotella pallens]|uniref:hypothetical protein n=1 Tax=Prevotella pallens TaxID=60133 RepID=UPI001CAE78F3|nr:hypothetical protein [Prevotella pallens]MBF1476190.1 hypothetical protein [Prevotella pallens]MBF1518369.1 hypothetical protein [Prevotella pallens]
MPNTLFCQNQHPKSPIPFISVSRNQKLFQCLYKSNMLYFDIYATQSSAKTAKNRQRG